MTYSIAIINQWGIIAGGAAIEALLRPFLVYGRRVYSHGGPTGYRERVQECELYEIDPRGQLCFWAGFVPRVACVLRTLGHEVNIDDQRQPTPRVCLDGARLSLYGARHREIARAIAEEPIGQIEVSGLNDAVAIISMVGRVFPKARIGVAVATRKMAVHIRTALASGIGETVGVAYTDSRRVRVRVYVGTYGILAARLDYRCGRRWDMLFLPRAEELRRRQILYDLDRMRIPRVYAMVQPQRCPDRLLQIRLEEIAGQIIHTLARPVAPVRVVFVPAPPPKRCAAAPKDPLERKRRMYWRNGTRNRYMSTIADMIVNRDADGLRRHGLDPDQLRLHRAELRVAILVETPEHAQQLVSMLPGWDVLRRYPKVPTKKARASSKVIVTSVYAAEYAVKADIIIRATGTGCPLRIKGFPPRTRDHASESLLIDLADRHCAQVARDTRLRADYYRRCRYTVVMPAL